MSVTPWHGPYLRVTSTALAQAVAESRKLPPGSEPQEFSIENVTSSKSSTLVRRLIFRCHERGRAVEFVRDEWVAKLPRGRFVRRRKEQS